MIKLSYHEQVQMMVETSDRDRIIMHVGRLSSLLDRLELIRRQQGLTITLPQVDADLLISLVETAIEQLVNSNAVTEETE